MKKYILLLCLASSLCAPAYAEKSNCDPKSLHCAYISGLSQTDSGRYIKVGVKGQFSPAFCMDYTGSFEITQGSATQLPLGKNTTTFYICQADEKTCEVVATDSFTLRKPKDVYTIQPAKHSIDLSSAKDEYPVCDPDAERVAWPQL